MSARARPVRKAHARHGGGTIAENHKSHAADGAVKASLGNIRFSALAFSTAAFGYAVHQL